MNFNNLTRIPVTILSGFLGAGKTTLLNHLVQQNPDKKLAIIENEFGEISIDSELVIGVENDIFELSNGCICCSLNGDLLEILLKLVNRPEKIDHLIIETTGIADPAPIALNFLTDEKIQKMFRLDAIITLVDAVNIEQQLENQDEACKQVALADILLLNKTDLADAYTKETVRNILKNTNPQAEIYETKFGKLDGINLLEINAFAINNIQKTKFEEILEKNKAKKFSLSAQNKAENPVSVFGNHLKTPKHSQISSVSFVFKEPLDILKFNLWIRFLLQTSTRIYRIKGILSFENEDAKIVFQSVHDQFVTESAGEWKNEERISKLVFIGKNLEQLQLEKGLKSCYFNDEIFQD